MKLLISAHIELIYKVYYCLLKNAIFYVWNVSIEKTFTAFCAKLKHSNGISIESSFIVRLKGTRSEMFGIQMP